MNPELSKKVVDKIESLCGQGCTEVNHLIERGKNGNRIDELSEFTHSESRQILHELNQIMSIYEK